MLLITKFRDQKFLLTKIAAKSHHSGVREVQMMLSTLKRIIKVNRMNIKSAADVMKVDKPHLVNVETLRYETLAP